MIELSALRKNKITLADYDYGHDIQNRLIMAQFSTQDLEVLEEILYSSLSLSMRKLSKTLDIDEENLIPILEKLSKTGLLKLNDETIVVDKDMRKYYELQMPKFDDDFTPGMEFLQGLLRKAPIHVLPIWYSIPRTSNNIFDSLIEKYLLTPQIYQRYLLELNFGDPVISGIINDLFSSPDFKLFSHDLIEKYGLTREQFEEYLLHLEFNFVCCLGYNKDNDLWKEVVTPFHEWREYLRFLRDTEASPIPSNVKISRRRSHDFSFVQDMAAVLNLAKTQPIALVPFSDDKILPQKAGLAAIAAKCEKLDEKDPVSIAYIQEILTKLCLLKLADIVDGRLYALESANDWLDMRLENRALFIYRHPLNKLKSVDLPPYLCAERTVREAEKSIMRVLNTGWVYFDDFFKSVLVPLSESSLVMLKKTGKTWKYTLPQYTDEERSLIKATIYEWLFEAGVVATGTAEGKDCFSVTPFGNSLFGR